MRSHHQAPSSTGHQLPVPLPPRKPSAGGMRVLWEERVTRSPAPEQLQVVVPVIGWFTGPAFGYLVGAALQQHWSSGNLAGLAVRSVAGHLDQRRARRVLTLLVTFDAPVCGQRRLDGAQMARDVIAAVRWAEFAANPSESTMAVGAAATATGVQTPPQDGATQRWNPTTGPIGVRRAP